MMKIIKNSLFIIIFSVILISLQNFPYIYLSLKTPKDRVYLGAQRYYPDYYGFISRINLGGKGILTSPLLITNEPNNASWIHWEYHVFGKIGSLFNLPPHITFSFSRAIFLLVYIFISFWFIGLFVKNSLHKNLILILSFFYNGFFFLNLNNFYQPTDFIDRLNSDPHKLIGMSLTILILYAIYKQKFLTAAFFSLFIGFVHGTSAVNLIAALLLFLFLQFISFKKNLRSLIKDNLFVFLSLSLLPIALLYWKITFSKIPVFNYIMLEWEKFYFLTDLKAPFLPVLTSYLFILGPLIILSALGLKKFVEENKKNGLLLLSFLVSNFLLLFAGFVILNTSKIRFYQTPYLLFLSIMAYYGLLFLAKKTHIKNGFFVFISTALIITLGIPNIFNGINKFIAPYKNSQDLAVYLPVKWYKAILWLENTPQNSVVLSLLKAGQIIAATPGRRVVIGAFVGSYNQSKIYPAENFFKGQMTVSQAKAYLQKERVDYIFYGLEEKSYSNLNQYSSILKPVFENVDAIIYKVAL